MPKDTHSTLPADAELVLPDQVTVALAELAGAARQGLLVLAVGTGLGVLGSLLDTDVERLVGPGAATTRSGPWSVTAPSPAESPSAAAGSGSTGRGSAARRHRRAGSAHLAGVRWDRAVGPARGGADAGQAVHPPLPPWLEPVGSRAEPASSGTSRSAVSRRFVAATERALAELLAADLSGLELVALLIDGIRVADRSGRGSWPSGWPRRLSQGGARRRRHHQVGSGRVLRLPVPGRAPRGPAGPPPWPPAR